RARVAFRNERRSLSLRKLRTDSLHAGADSLRQNRGRLRECCFTSFHHLMPRRPSIARGKSLFGDAAPETKPAAAAFRINIDGGSRGNPGPAAYGVVIRDARGGIVAQRKKYIGRVTNHVAECYGLVAALDYAQSHGVRAVRHARADEVLV